jgi:hypothetical protein
VASDLSEAPGLIQTMRRNDQILVHFFDNWETAAKDLAVRMSRWLKTGSIRNYQADFGSKSVATYPTASTSAGGANARSAGGISIKQVFIQLWVGEGWVRGGLSTSFNVFPM